MKGIIFTEFLDMVDDKFSVEITEKIISQCDLESDGAYTATGTYSHTEILSLVMTLHKQCGASVQDLCRTFGAHLFQRFSILYPVFFDGHQNAFSFLETVENYIHVEVLKLFPEAKLPSIQGNRLGDDSMEVIYRSHRCLTPVCHGLILGCLDYFDHPATIEVEDLSAGYVGHARFLLCAEDAAA